MLKNKQSQNENNISKYINFQNLICLTQMIIFGNLQYIFSHIFVTNITYVFVFLNCLLFIKLKNTAFYNNDSSI